jgi:hypothetical protein
VRTSGVLARSICSCFTWRDNSSRATSSRGTSTSPSDKASLVYMGQRNGGGRSNDETHSYLLRLPLLEAVALLGYYQSVRGMRNKMQKKTHLDPMPLLLRGLITILFCLFGLLVRLLDSSSKKNGISGWHTFLRKTLHLPKNREFFLRHIERFQNKICLRHDAHVESRICAGPRRDHRALW